MAKKPAKRYEVTLRPTKKTPEYSTVSVEANWMFVNNRGDLEFAYSKTNSYYNSVSVVAAFATGSWISAKQITD